MKSNNIVLIMSLILLSGDFCYSMQATDDTKIASAASKLVSPRKGDTGKRLAVAASEHRKKKPRRRSFFSIFQAALDAKSPEDVKQYCAAIKEIHRPGDAYVLSTLEGEDVSLLHAAAAADHADVISFLIDNKIVEINVKNGKGKTALFFAKGVKAAAALIKHGIDINHTLHQKRRCVKADAFVSVEVAAVIKARPEYKADIAECCTKCPEHCCKKVGR